MRISIASGQPTMGHGLALLLAEAGPFEVVSELGSESDLIMETAQSEPDLLLVDPDLPGLDLESLVDQVGLQSPATGVVVVAASDDVQYLQMATGAGARGYVSTLSTPAELAQTLQAAALGQVVAASPSLSSLSDFVRAASATPESGLGVSQRELEVVRLVAAGLTNREIATRLTLTENTIKVHLRSVYAKLGVRNRAELVTHAMRVGLASAPQSPQLDEA